MNPTSIAIAPYKSQDLHSSEFVTFVLQMLVLVLTVATASAVVIGSFRGAL